MSDFDKVIAHAMELLPEETYGGTISVAFRIGDDLYGAEAAHAPAMDKDGKPTGRWRLEVKVKRIEHPGELVP